MEVRSDVSERHCHARVNKLELIMMYCLLYFK